MFDSLFSSATEELEEVLEDVKKETKNETTHHLIIWNDEVNTFDWVIKALIEICHHTEEQAEQCTLIIHHNGKYAVKDGNLDTLRPMKEAFIDWELARQLINFIERCPYCSSFRN